MIYPECRMIISRRKNPKKLKQDGKFDGKDCKTIDDYSVSYLLQYQEIHQYLALAINLIYQLVTYTKVF